MLYKNDVFAFPDGQRARLLHVEPARNEAWVISLSIEDSFPKCFSLSDLQAKVDAGELTHIDSGPATPIAKRVSDKARSRRDIAWQRIAPLVDKPGIYSPSERSQLVQERAKEIGCTLFTLYKDLRRYWRGGQTRDALIPGFHSCGRAVKSVTVGRGRTPTSSRYQVYQLRDQDIQHIKGAIKKYYLSGEVHTMESSYQQMLEEAYEYIDGNGEAYILPLGERPSLRQFQHVLKTHFSDETKLRKRKGDKLFEQNHRAREGSILEDCLGVGHIYEIDATIADIFSVASFDRSLIIGKPSMYLIYDRGSRLVVGWYLGLEAPSWPAAMQAILSIAEDKAELCKRLGVEYNAADWPAHSVFPQKFLGDLGEMVSKNSTLLIEGLEIGVDNTPSMRPDYKSTVECGFKLVQRSMAPSTPGYEPPENVTRRRGKHYENDACLTLHELKALVLRNIIAHNRRVMTGYPISNEMLADEIRPIPTEIWNHQAPKRMGVLTRYSEQYVRFSLLPQAEATVTRDGIEFKGCYYTCPEAIEEGWLVKAGRGVFKKEVSFDHRLVDSIYIHDPKDPTNFIVATLLEKSREYAGLSFAEVAAYETLKAHIRRDAEQHNRQTQADYHAFSKPITSAALAETKRVSKGKSRSARKKDIEQDRFTERREQRQVEARMPLEAKPELAATSPNDNVIALQPASRPPAENPDAPLTMEEKVRRKRMEMLKNAKQ